MMLLAILVALGCAVHTPPPPPRAVEARELCWWPKDNGVELFWREPYDSPASTGVSALTLHQAVTTVRSRRWPTLLLDEPVHPCEAQP